MLSLTACHEPEVYPDSALGTFDCLWETVDRNYCFFDEKDVDWNSMRDKYRPKIIEGINRRQLFEVCADMLAELRDGHVNLSSPFDVSYYRNWWSDYPQDFDYRTVQQYYLNFDYRTLGVIDYAILPQNIGYVRYSTFGTLPGEGNLDYVFDYLAVCDALIIDVRDNGGGLLTNITPFVSRLIHTKGTYGYIRHKTGPGHADFSAPYPLQYSPATDHVVWNKPVAVLTNRSCYSAANTFVSVMRQIPGVVIVGSRTGGGGGLPFSAELPGGWTVRFSASPTTDALGRSIEQGVEPSPGCEAHAPAAELAAGHDAILDKAIEVLTR